MKAYTTYIESISGYSDVLSSVRATQKVAAASLIRESAKIADLNEAFKALKNISLKLRRISDINMGELANSDNKKVLIVIMGDKGLCGDLYPRIARLLSGKSYQEVVLVGESGKKYLNEVEVNPSAIFATSDFEKVYRYLIEKYFEARLGADILFAESVTLSKSEPKLTDIFSVLTENTEKTDVEIGEGFPIFASGKRDLKKILITNLLKLNLYAATLKAKISEYSARTVAMESAVDKTEKVITGLKKDYFRKRRHFATQKQLESFIAHTNEL